MTTSERALSALLLAGGQSRRMGVDKQRLRRAHEPLCDDLLGFLSAISDDVIVSTNTPERYDHALVHVVTDHHKGQGPLAGVHAALMAAQHDWLYVLACDMPAYDRRLVTALCQARTANVDAVAVRRHDGQIEPFHALYHRRLIEPLDRALRQGQSSACAFLRTVRVAWIDEATLTDLDLSHLFMNVNRPEDLAKASVSLDNHVVSVMVERMTASTTTQEHDLVIDERKLVLHVDGEHETTPASFWLLDERLEDFVVGHLYASGRLRSLSDLTDLRLTYDLDAIHAYATIRPTITPHRPHLMTSAALPEDLAHDWATLLTRMNALDDAGERFRLTGSTHVVVRLDDALHIVDTCEDVSRHVAVDKVIGRAVQSGASLITSVLLTSCRLTVSIVEKAITAGVRLIVSRAAVTNAALAVARRHGVTLAAFARGSRMNVYRPSC